MAKKKSINNPLERLLKGKRKSTVFNNKLPRTKASSFAYVCKKKVECNVFFLKVALGRSERRCMFTRRRRLPRRLLLRSISGREHHGGLG